MSSATYSPSSLLLERRAMAQFFAGASWKWTVVAFWTVVLFVVALWTAMLMLQRLIAQVHPSAPPFVVLTSHLLLNLPVRAAPSPPVPTPLLITPPAHVEPPVVAVHREIPLAPAPAVASTTARPSVANVPSVPSFPSVPKAPAPVAQAASPSTTNATNGANASGIAAAEGAIAAALDGKDLKEVEQIQKLEKGNLASERVMGVHIGVLPPSAYRYASKEEIFALRLNPGGSTHGIYFLPSSLFKDGPPALSRDELIEISERMRRALETAESPVVHFSGPGGFIDAGDIPEVHLNDKGILIPISVPFDLNPKQISLSQSRAKVEAQRIVDQGIIAVSLDAAPKP